MKPAQDLVADVAEVLLSEEQSRPKWPNSGSRSPPTTPDAS